MFRSKFVVIIPAILIVVVAAAAFTLSSHLNTTVNTMQFIESRLRGGKIIDYDQSIAVDSVEDIGWWKKDDVWYIMYGKLQLELPTKKLKDKLFLEKLGRIGIDIRGNLEEGRLRFYWFGAEVKEWVPQ